MRRNRAKGKRPRQPDALPVVGATWEADAVDVASLIGIGAHEPPEVVVVLAVEVETGAVVCMEELTDPTPGSVAQAVANAQKQPQAGPPRCPRRILVRDAQVAACLARILPSGSTVGVRAELPHLDVIQQDIGREMTRLSQLKSTYTAIPGMTPDRVAAFFHAAAEFYASAPWDLLDEDEPVAVELPGVPRPLYAVILGGADVTHGLALYLDASDLIATYDTSPEFTSPSGNTIVVSYTAESEISEQASQERRRYRWPLAGPAAYPLLLRTDVQGDVTDPTPADFDAVTVALRAIVRIVRDDSAILDGRETLIRELLIDDTAGATISVRVRFPAELSASTAGNLDLFADTPAQSASVKEAPLLKDTGSTYSRSAQLMADVIGRIFKSPQTKSVLKRLAWSFFRDRAPTYLEADEQTDAVTRFYDWAFFIAAVGPEGRSLAQMVNDSSIDLDQQERIDRAALLEAVYVVSRVVSVRRGQGFSLVDVFTDELYHVQLPDTQEGPRSRDWFFGVLLPLGNGEYLAGGSAFSARPVSEQQTQLMELQEIDPRTRALAVEDVLFGASNDWIDELPPDQLRRAYAAFRADFGGVALPALPKLKKQIQSTDAPADVFGLAANVPWASMEEFNVFGAFVRRLWNTTPRKELGGITPEESYTCDR